MNGIRWFSKWLAGTTAFLIAGMALFAAEPKVLLYHSFDADPAKADYSTAPVTVDVGTDVATVDDAVMGKAAKFPERGVKTTVRIDLGEMVPAEAWTIALWQIIEVKTWLTAPENNLLTLLDAEGKPILKLSKSGGLFVYRDGKGIYFECFDALYWVQNSREHLAITWQADGSGVPSPRGLLTAYFRARPYAAFAMNLDRTPAAILLGEAAAGTAVDELYVLDAALPLRGIWDLMRQKPAEIPALEKQLADRCAKEEARPTTTRNASWAEQVKKGTLFEAEAAPGDVTVITCPTKNKKKPSRMEGGDNPGAVASGNACVNPGRDKVLSVPFEVKDAGEYALSLRYQMARRIHPMWPQDSKAKTPWTENFATVAVALDGKPLGGGTESLYPTGVCSGHRGDVTMWAWHALQGGGRTQLSAGKHTLTVTFKDGLAESTYDALLVSQKSGEMPPHPRWVDQYRIPPAWWVKSHATKTGGGKRTDTYVVTLRNRCDEPCSYSIIADNEKALGQTVCASVDKIALAPFEEKELAVTFSLDDKPGISGWGNIYLWNEDVALRQKYRLWNITRTAEFSGRKHPVLLPAPDAEKQKAFREWLKTRDEKTIPPKVKKWRGGPGIHRIGQGDLPVRPFRNPLAGKHLEALDTWMSMSTEELDQFLPDGPAEFNGYGTGWERTGLEYSNLWHQRPEVASVEPKGDIDYVRKLTVKAPDYKDLQKKKKDPSITPKTYTKTYEAGKDNDLISCVRDTRWQAMIGFGHYGAAPYKDTVLTRVPHSGIPIVAEAYYLTGDPAYAKKAFQMLMVLTRKYTALTKHFNWALHREDRDWWGGRINGRYLSKFGMRTMQSLGTYVIDLTWDALTPEERNLIEHNVQRLGMIEGMSGVLFEWPNYMAGVNNEDLPYLELGQVLGDTGPLDGLEFFYSLFKGMILPDGIHQCSLGSYGGVNTHAGRMKTMGELGLNVYSDPALRNLFTAQPSFIFAGGGFPNIGDGGGVGLNGLGAGFGCCSPAQYEWGYQLFEEPTFKQWPDLIRAAQRVCNGKPEEKAERMKAEYLDNPAFDLKALWPNIYIAPVKGLAILRNRVPEEPIDWIEVIFDYGLMGGRTHGHPAKLATLPSFNGQLVSMEYGYGKLGKLMQLYINSYVHNVVVMDESSQFGSGGAVQVGSLRESYENEGLQWIDAESTRIYDGIYMRRTVFTTSFGIVDLYLCRADDDKDHLYDWMFHSFGVAATDGKMKDLDKLSDTTVLRFAENPRSSKRDGVLKVTWENHPVTKPPTKASTAMLHENAYVRLWSAPQKGTTLILFEIPMNQTVGNKIDYAMVRRTAKHTVFATVQEPWRESTAPKVRFIRQLTVTAEGKKVPAHESYALEVALQDGKRKVFYINASESMKKIGRVTTDAAVGSWSVMKDGSIRDPRYSRDAALFLVR